MVRGGGTRLHAIADGNMGGGICLRLVMKRGDHNCRGLMLGMGLAV
jgi:hypothetical protein